MEHENKHETKHEAKHEVIREHVKSIKRDLAHNYMIWGLGIIIVLLLVALVQINGIKKNLNELNTNLDSLKNSGVQQKPAPSPLIDMNTLADDDDVKGDKNVLVTIVEFSDYECTFCARFYSETLGQIDREYIKTGKVKFVYRDFPLNVHPNAQKAAEAAECAGEQGKYYEMHNKLFEQGVKGGIASFKEFAKDIGIDATKFNNCLDSGQMAAEIQKDMKDGAAAGIR